MEAIGQLDNSELECHGGHGGHAQSGGAFRRTQVIASKWTMGLDARTYGKD